MDCLNIMDEESVNEELKLRNAAETESQREPWQVENVDAPYVPEGYIKIVKSKFLMMLWTSLSLSMYSTADFSCISHLVIETMHESSEKDYHLEDRWDIQRENDESGDSCILEVYVKVTMTSRVLRQDEIMSGIINRYVAAYEVWVDMAHERLTKKKTRKNEGLTNREKVESLYQAFIDLKIEKAGSVDFQAFEDETVDSEIEKVDFHASNEEKDEIVDSDIKKVESEILDHNLGNEEKDDNVGFKVSDLLRSMIKFSKLVEALTTAKTVICFTRELLGIENADIERTGEVNSEGLDSSSSGSKGVILEIIGLVAATLPIVHKVRDMSRGKGEDKNLESKQPSSLRSGITYQVIDEGGGEEAISKYQQACFRFKLSSSAEVTFFEGTPIELAIKLSEVHAKAADGWETTKPFFEAIKGMKLNGRRIIVIPPEVTGLDENTFLDLTLTNMDDHKPRKLNPLASKL
ncbi:hypothetical protein ACFE04_001348 [Oxalis oulophora]